MALFFITGISGSGKSSVCRELKSRGYEAYDTDEDGLSKWQHNVTGYVHPKSSVKKEARTEAFLKSHSWNVQRNDLEEIARQAKSKPVFICGVIDNLNDLLDLFTAIFALVIDEDTLKHRLATRTDNDWGKQPHELQWTINQQAYKNVFYKKAGFITVDAVQSIASVVDNIVKEVQQLEASRV